MMAGLLFCFLFLESFSGCFSRGRGVPLDFSMKSHISDIIRIVHPQEYSHKMRASMAGSTAPSWVSLAAPCAPRSTSWEVAGSAKRLRSLGSIWFRARLAVITVGSAFTYRWFSTWNSFSWAQGGAALGTQVVQDQQGHRLHLLEELVVGGVGVRTEGRTQVVQQVRDHDKEDRGPALHALAGDGRGQVGLAGATGAHQGEPPLRVLGIGPGGVESGQEASAGMGGTLAAF